jgi:hypothetical protein
MERCLGKWSEIFCAFVLSGAFVPLSFIGDWTLSWSYRFMELVVVHGAVKITRRCYLLVLFCLGVLFNIIPRLPSSQSRILHDSTLTLCTYALKYLCIVRFRIALNFITFRHSNICVVPVHLRVFKHISCCRIL